MNPAISIKGDKVWNCAVPGNEKFKGGRKC